MKNNSDIKPFVKWAGGKGQLLPVLLERLPQGFAQDDSWTYIEPFVGGGALLFQVMSLFPNVRRAVINDNNPALIIAYQTVKNNVTKLIQCLRRIEKEFFALDDAKRKEYFLAQRTTYNRLSLNQPVEKSALLIFLNRTCFNGLYRVNQKGEFNVPFGRYANPLICDERTLLADSEVLQKVEIMHGDYEQTLAKATGKTVFYFDPPYKPLTQTASFTAYTIKSFDDGEQIRLASFCNKCDRKGFNWLLSNSDTSLYELTPLIESLYKNYFIEKTLAKRMINSNAKERGKICELLISNFKGKVKLKEIQA